jgi:hypothetical protein
MARVETESECRVGRRLISGLYAEWILNRKTQARHIGPGEKKPEPFGELRNWPLVYSPPTVLDIFQQPNGAQMNN